MKTRTLQLSSTLIIILSLFLSAIGPVAVKAAAPVAPAAPASQAMPAGLYPAVLKAVSNDNGDGFQAAGPAAIGCRVELEHSTEQLRASREYQCGGAAANE